MKIRRQTEIERALRACRTSMLVVIFISFGVNLLALATPLYMLQLYDRVLTSRSTDTLIMLTLIVLMALAILGALDALRREILARIASWLEERLQPAVFAAGMRFAQKHDPRVAGQGLRDLATVRGFLTGPAMTPLMDTPWTPLFLGALFLLHPVLGWVGIAGAIFLLALALLNEFATRRPLERANAAAGKVLRRAEAALQNAEVVRAMGLLGGLTRQLSGEQAAVQAAQRSAGVRGGIILALSRFGRLAVQALVMGTAAWLVIQDGLSAGAIFAASFLLSRGLAPIENSISTWKQLVAARDARSALRALAAAAPPPAEAMSLPQPRGVLELERVGYVPPNGDAATLRGISLTLESGEMLGVIGPSAAGKSTLARLMVGAWTPSSGHVRLDGAEISLWLDSGGAAYIGYLPQDVELFAGTVRENISRFDDADPDEVIEAADRAGMHEIIMRLPRGYDTEIGAGGAQLSGGQRQRLALARALFGRPRLVVLDEPNSSLDHDGETALQTALADLKDAGVTLVVITHRAGLLNLADKILLLHGGRTSAFGSRADVAAKLNAGAAAEPAKAAIRQKQRA